MGCADVKGVASNERQSPKVRQENKEMQIEEFLDQMNIVCEICSVCFNTKDRAPILLCSFNHSACRVCVDQFGQKGISKCPFCRNDLSLSNMTQNQGITSMLQKFESEEKAMVAKNPSMMSEEELLEWTLQEAKKHKYQDVIKKLVSNSRVSVKTITTVNEKGGNISIPIDLSIFANIQGLHLDGKSFRYIGYFGCLPKLQTLSLQRNSIEKIIPLNSYYRLTYLSLRGNKIRKIQNLNVLSNLQELRLDYNCIEKIENIQTLVSLEFLSLAVNRISKLEGLEKMAKLKELILNSNKISKIENLDFLSELSVLELGNNQIGKIQNLNSLKSLEKLGLVHNNILEIQNLFDFPKLKEVKLNYNPYSKEDNAGALEALRQTFRINVSDKKHTEYYRGQYTVEWPSVSEEKKRGYYYQLHAKG